VTSLPPFLSPAGLFGQASFSTNVEDVVTLVQSTGKRTGMDLKDDLILIGSIVVVAALLFYLTAVFRKSGRRHRDRDHRERSVPATARVSEDPTAANGKIRRRKRRRDHRPRNPTRAETGGLPPRREGDELPPGETPPA
jgi:hypothetical protein